MSTLLIIAALLLCAASVMATALAFRRGGLGRVAAFASGDGRRFVAEGDRQDGGNAYFAVLEFDRFTALRNTIDFALANAILHAAGTRISAVMNQVQLWRTGQSTVEFTFRAASVDQARRDLASCLDALGETIEISGLEFRLQARVAFASLGTARASAPDAVFGSVVTALSRNGSDRVRLADEVARGAASVDDLDILRALPQAIAQNELALHYQPKFDCRSGGVSSAEALLRWTSPTLGAIPTDRIIELAERTGAIRDITVWVLKQAARDQEALQAAGHELTIFVNLSGLLIADRRFVLEMLQLIRQAPGKLGIEITETAVITDPDAAIENIEAFSAAGIPVAIDDFGSGLCSLAYLKRLPADELKIDRVFISSLTNSNRDPLIVRAAIDLAHALEMKVTAEGVDDPMSLSLLRVMGCDMLQGYFISRPVPLPKLVSFLENEKPHLEASMKPRLWSPARAGSATAAR
jgi:EAL domain-containing protein (putative c-di-GMP-specific phosphodiesterase class I)